MLGELPDGAADAVDERVADELDGLIHALCGDSPPAEVRSAGGGARSDVWLQIKANRTGVPFVATDAPEPTSLGAAMLAAQALSLGDVRDLAPSWVKPRVRLEPR